MEGFIFVRKVLFGFLFSFAIVFMSSAQKIVIKEKRVLINSVEINDEKSIIKALGEPDSLIRNPSGVTRFEYNDEGLTFYFQEKDDKLTCSLHLRNDIFSGKIYLDEFEFDRKIHLYQLVRLKNIVFDPLEIEPYPNDSGNYAQSAFGNYFERQIGFIYSGSPNDLGLITHVLF